MHRRLNKNKSSLTVVVKSCGRDRDLDFHDAIRETWGKDLLDNGCSLKFVTGSPTSKRASDEINFDCDDSYLGLPEKTQRICNWAYLKRWGHIFLCDTDTLVDVSKLLALPYEDFDYAGGFKGGQAEVGKQFEYIDKYIYSSNFNRSMLLWPWASGGYGYFLSPKAQAVVGGTPSQVWAEDMYVGQVLGPIPDLNIAAFPMRKVTTHIPKDGSWSPEVLKKWYHDFKS
jgi:Galactosyltransferase